MLKPEFTSQFKKDYKVALRRGLSRQDLQNVIELLCSQTVLPPCLKDHALKNSRNYKGMRELHMKPNWLLIYKINKDRLVLELIRTGSHSDLF